MNNLPGFLRGNAVPEVGAKGVKIVLGEVALSRHR